MHMKTGLMFVRGLVALAPLGLVLSMSGADKVFTGAVDANWNTPGNWEGGAVPVDGDSVTLASTTVTTINNDIEGLTLSGFTFAGYGSQGAGGTGSSNNAYLTGKKIKLSAGANIALTSSVRINQYMPIELLEGAHEISVATGARWDTVGTGPSFTGAGSLTQTSGTTVLYAGSTFTGGYAANGGTSILLFNGHGLGDGPITFENNAILTLYKTGIDVTNSVTFNGEKSPNGNIIINFSATFSGPVTMNGQQRIKASSTAPVSLTFKGTVTHRGGLFVTNLGVRDLRHEIIFEGVFDSNNNLWMDGDGSVVRFRAPGNKFNTTRLAGGTIHYEADGACTANDQMGFLAGNVATAYFEGSQTINRIYRYQGETTDFAVSSENGGELTVRATRDEVWPGRIEGKLGFVWAPTGIYNFMAQGATPFSGRLVVSNGTFSVSSLSAGIPNISSLVVVGNGGLSLPTGAAVNSRLDTFEISSTATISIAAGAAFEVDHFIVDGDELAEDCTYTGGEAGEGQVHCDALPANVTVHTRVQPGPGVCTVWNGTGGAADSTSLGVNWEGGSVPRLWEKCLPVFAGGASATLAGDTVVNGLAFETAGAFTINGDHSLSLYWGGLSHTNSTAVEAACTFNVPVRVCGAQTWRGALGGQSKKYVFNRTISDGDDLAVPIIVTDDAHCQFNAANTFTGDIEVNHGYIEVGADECLGSPSAGKVVIRRPDTAHAAFLRFTSPTARVSRAVELYGPDSNFYPVRSANSGTNEFAGPVLIGDAQNKRFGAYGTCTLVFSGGVTGKGMFYIQGTGKYVVKNLPIVTSGNLYSDVRADLTLAAPGNKFSGITWYNASVLRLETDGAIIDNPQINMLAGAAIDLNGHDLSLGLVYSSDLTKTQSVVRSETPATLYANPHLGNYALKAGFEGAASLVKAGANTLVMAGVSSSTGSVCSTKSTIYFNSGAGWTNGTVVVTNSGAAVMFAAGSFLGRNVDVRLATGGKLTLPDNARIVCRNLYFDGVKQRIGTYGNSTSAAANRNDTYFMTSSNNDLKGILDVQGDGRGTVVLFR